MSKTRVIMIGIDGGTWDLFEPWAKEGKMPNLKKLMDNGAWAEMESTMPFVTGPAWTSMFTGKNPGKHGIFDFVRYVNGHLKLCKSSDVKADRIYDILSEKGLKSIIIGLPFSYPPRKSFNGIMFSDFLYPKKDVFPESKSKYLDIYQVLADPFKPKRARAREISETAKNRIKLAKKLFLNEEWDFFFYYFPETDTVFHTFWYDMDKKNIYGRSIKKVIRLLDDFLGWLIENMEKNDVIVLVSDHGFGEYNYFIHLNSLLIKYGYAYVKENGGAEDENLSMVLKERKNKKIRNIKLNKTLIKVGHLPMIRPIARYIIKNKLNINIKNVPKIDYKKSKAFLATQESLGVYCTESCTSEDMENLRELLIKLKFYDKRVFQDVRSREEIYEGDKIDIAPKILLFLNDFMPSPALNEEIFVKTKFSWHKQNGIFLAYGHDVIRNLKINKIKIYDIAPTILHLYRSKIPRDSDGKVIKEILNKNSEFYKRHPVYSENIYEDRLKEKIRRLKKIDKL